MTTVGEDLLGPAADAASRRRRGARTAAWGACALAASLVLSACAPSYDYYVEGYWDNGDGMIVPSKTELFDDNAVPTCAFPVKYQLFESRGTPSGLAFGLVFEFGNRETDADAPISFVDHPTARDQERVRLLRERAKGSIPIIWQYTHPLFDEQYGVTDAAGDAALTAIKAELGPRLRGFGAAAPPDKYFEVAQIYMVTADGTFVLGRVDSPDVYMVENNIPLRFEGLRYTYFTATDGENEYLLVRSKSSTEAILWQGDTSVPLGEFNTFLRIHLYNQPPNGFDPPDPVVEFLFQSDNCPVLDGKAHERYYLRDYALLEPPPADEDEDSTDEAAEPAPSPSPSA